jgi:xanthine dehydrogenase small subunit
VMSMFGLYKSDSQNTREVIEDALTGNLCRCTGYQPILEAAEHVLTKREPDQFSKLENEVIEAIRSIPKDSVHIDTGEQKYFLPETLDELLNFRKKYPSAILINGATDIALRVTKQNELLKEIIDAEQIDKLKLVSENDKEVIFGSAVNVNKILDKSDSVFPALYTMCKVFGSKQIREMATIGGNLGTASPIGDLPPVLMAYDAQMVIQSQKSKRTVPLDDFITGYRQTVLQPDEIITEIKIPKPEKDRIIKSYKVSKRKDLDISTVSAAFCLRLGNDNLVSDIKIIYGGMAEMTKHAEKAEQFLKGKKWSIETIKLAMSIIEKEFTPISDARSGADFRMLTAKNLLLKFWSEYSHEKEQNAQNKNK